MLNLDDVYTNWLTSSGICTCGVSPILQKLVENLNISLANGNKNSIQRNLKLLHQYCGETCPDSDKARIFLESGRALCKMADAQPVEQAQKTYGEAVKLFRRAAFWFQPYIHELAVARWMLGFALWKSSYYDQAFDSWRACYSTLEDLMFNYSGSKETAYWYQQRMKELETHVEEAVKEQMTLPGKES